MKDLTCRFIFICCAKEVKIPLVRQDWTRLKDTVRLSLEFAKHLQTTLGTAGHRDFLCRHPLQTATLSKEIDGAGIADKSRSHHIPILEVDRLDTGRLGTDDWHFFDVKSQSVALFCDEHDVIQDYRRYSNDHILCIFEFSILS